MILATQTEKLSGTSGQHVLPHSEQIGLESLQSFQLSKNKTRTKKFHPAGKLKSSTWISSTAPGAVSGDPHQPAIGSRRWAPNRSFCPKHGISPGHQRAIQQNGTKGTARRNHLLDVVPHTGAGCSDVARCLGLRASLELSVFFAFGTQNIAHRNRSELLVCPPDGIGNHYDNQP